MTTKVKGVFSPPAATGYAEWKPVLCIGLDIAWFGGSKNNADSQYDFAVATHFNDQQIATSTTCTRIKLTDRDPSGSLTFAELEKWIEPFKSARVVVAIDAPLQATHKTAPEGSKRLYRRCERVLQQNRRLLDRSLGGACGWHPTIQPGVPLAPRVQAVLAQLVAKKFKPWTEPDAQYDRLAMECFPAEAIWSAKRQNQLSSALLATEMKVYKAQDGCYLTVAQVEKLVRTTLVDGFKNLTGLPGQWPTIVENVLQWLLKDTTWQRHGAYRGGKLLDDVVDSCLCLATAISYATNNAHVWTDPQALTDGHIIGPGGFVGIM